MSEPKNSKESGHPGPLLRLPQLVSPRNSHRHLVPPLDVPRAASESPSFYDACAARLPSWLSSLLIHLELVIILGVIVVKIPSRPGQTLLSFEVGGGSGQGESTNGLELNRALAARSETIAAASDPMLVTAPQNEIDARLSIEVLEPTIPQEAVRSQLAESALLSTHEIRNAGTRSGRGGGQGDGVGADGVGSGFGTAPTRTRVFGVVEEARSFVYVFDHSDSMVSALSYTSEGKTVFSITALEAAKAELLRSLDDLDANQGFQIVFYNHVFNVFEDQGLSTHLIRATPENKQRASGFVASTYGAGSTNHMPALEAALYLRPEAIFLLTDGEAKDDPSQADLAFIRNLNRNHTKINVIHFCFVPRMGSTLAQLAEENRGRHLSFSLSRLGPGMQKAASRDGKNADGNAAQENALTDPRLRQP